ncbi:uncharacterized protein BXZ73DRAFT_79813 [Epithele typhae]|uniref:uncharacterized protein n=2 Tax=Epithele typhae TaxID=378194 RepID=UPI002007649C|nr:uncharacterized protein BXZ73DRAFT_79813 [Epithele typhae]KAH9922021.1 hypothetical protein BXZ73DRAFT_79813 [Epithele typhae]
MGNMLSSLCLTVSLLFETVSTTGSTIADLGNKNSVLKAGGPTVSTGITDLGIQTSALKARDLSNKNSALKAGGVQKLGNEDEQWIPVVKNSALKSGGDQKLGEGFRQSKTRDQKLGNGCKKLGNEYRQSKTRQCRNLGNGGTAGISVMEGLPESRGQLVRPSQTEYKLVRASAVFQFRHLNHATHSNKTKSTSYDRSRQGTDSHQEKTTCLGSAPEAREQFEHGVTSPPLSRHASLAGRLAGARETQPAARHCPALCIYNTWFDPPHDVATTENRDVVKAHRAKHPLVQRTCGSERVELHEGRWREAWDARRVVSDRSGGGVDKRGLASAALAEEENGVLVENWGVGPSAESPMEFAWSASRWSEHSYHQTTTYHCPFPTHLTLRAGNTFEDATVRANEVEMGEEERDEVHASWQSARGALGDWPGARWSLAHPTRAENCGERVQKSGGHVAALPILGLAQPAEASSEKQPATTWSRKTGTGGRRDKMMRQAYAVMTRWSATSTGALSLVSRTSTIFRPNPPADINLMQVSSSSSSPAPQRLWAASAATAAMWKTQTWAVRSSAERVSSNAAFCQCSSRMVASSRGSLLLYASTQEAVAYVSSVSIV